MQKDKLAYEEPAVKTYDREELLEESVFTQFRS